MTRKPARPQNFRLEKPRVCGFCRKYTCKCDDSGWGCEREGYDIEWKEFGADNAAQFKHTCDRWEER